MISRILEAVRELFEDYEVYHLMKSSEAEDEGDTEKEKQHKQIAQGYERLASRIPTKNNPNQL